MKVISKFPEVFTEYDFRDTPVTHMTRSQTIAARANYLLQERMKPLYLVSNEHYGLQCKSVVRITAEKCEDNVSNAFVMWTLEPQPIVREPLKTFMTVISDRDMPPDEIHLIDSTGKKVGVFKNFSVEEITESGRE